MNSLFDDARDSISSYCINECNAYCCRKGYLILKKEELFVVNNDLSKVKELEDFFFSLNLEGGCPSLVDNKCLNYSKRPNTCRKFPIFVEESVVRLSLRCFAVKNGLLYPYIKLFLKAGYSVEGPN